MPQSFCSNKFSWTGHFVLQDTFSSANGKEELKLAPKYFACCWLIANEKQLWGKKKGFFCRLPSVLVRFICIHFFTHDYGISNCLSWRKEWLTVESHFLFSNRPQCHSETTKLRVPFYQIADIVQETNYDHKDGEPEKQSAAQQMLNSTERNRNYFSQERRCHTARTLLLNLGCNSSLMKPLVTLYSSFSKKST